MVKMVHGENANVVKRFSLFSEWIPDVQKLESSLGRSLEKNKKQNIKVCKRLARKQKR